MFTQVIKFAPVNQAKENNMSNNKPHWDVYRRDSSHNAVYPHQDHIKQDTIDTNKNILICKKITFYSPNDEVAFFEWLKKNDCIDDIKGIGDELHLTIAADELYDHDLRDLIALFHRYQIDMKQLKRFLTTDNKKWFFDNKKAYWHKQVFEE